MHHTKFEKNRSSGYQEDVKNVQMFALPWGQNRYPEDYKFHTFRRGFFALHHHAFSFSSTCVALEKKIFENWSILGSFCFAPKAPGGQGP
jgi:hypothetical protein